MFGATAAFALSVGWLPISVWDAVDVAVVAYLLYQVYYLVRGSIAFNIVVGIVLLYAVYFAVGILGMDMLRLLLGQFVSVGFIVVLIVFQPEVRRFLVLLGNTTLRRRSSVISFLLRRLGIERAAATDDTARAGERLAVKQALLAMAKTKTGALIVFTENAGGEPIGPSGTRMNATVSEPLLRTIFDKHTPLHDGAVLIERGRIYAAGCVLPVTDRSDLPQSVGLRHRAAVGLTERSRATAFVVSEETGLVSVARGGRLLRRLSETKLEEELRAAY